MPRLRPVQDCRQHPDGICECYRAPPQASQSMEELDYLRSACAAAQEGNTTRLEEILCKCPEALQDDGHRGSTGYSPLHYAARGGHGAAVDLLLRQGASVNAATSAGRATPLHRASYMGHLHILEKLVSHGADGDLQDSDGETALHKAAKQGHLQVYNLLAQHFPTAATLKNRHSKTPMDCLPP